MSDDAFYDYVVDWDKLVAEIETKKKQLKKLTDIELPIRKAIATSLGATLPEGLAEGVNIFTLRDGRKLKLTHTIKREIDEAQIVPTREAYAMLNDNPIAFDTLLRVKYELAKAEWNKLEGEPAKVVSRMLVSKDSAPTLVLD